MRTDPRHQWTETEAFRMRSSRSRSRSSHAVFRTTALRHIFTPRAFHSRPTTLPLCVPEGNDIHHRQMAFHYRYFYYIILILSPVPLILLGAASNAVAGAVVADTPIGNVLIDTSKIVFNAL